MRFPPACSARNDVLRSSYLLARVLWHERKRKVLRNIGTDTEPEFGLRQSTGMDCSGLQLRVGSLHYRFLFVALQMCSHRPLSAF